MALDSAGLFKVTCRSRIIQLTFPGKAYASVKKRLQSILNLRFRRTSGPVARILEGSQEFAYPVHRCFVASVNAMTLSPRVSCQGYYCEIWGSMEVGPICGS